MHHDREPDPNEFWTDIPEGGDMLPGALPGFLPGGIPVQRLDDLYPTGHHAAQRDEYGTGIDPNSPAAPGDTPHSQPDGQSTDAETGGAPEDETGGR